VSLYLTTQADRIGRRRMLLIGAALMTAAGIAFAFTHQMWLLVVAGTIGVISPSGQEVGPFLSIEQAALSQAPSRARTGVFACTRLRDRSTRRAILRGLSRALQRTDAQLPRGGRRVCVFGRGAA
jgi:MFS family permease